MESLYGFIIAQNESAWTGEWMGSTKEEGGFRMPRAASTALVQTINVDQLGGMINRSTGQTATASW